MTLPFGTPPPATEAPEAATPPASATRDAPPSAVIAAPALDPAPIIAWLLTEGRALPDAGAVLEGLARRLVAAGVPVWRMTLHLPQLHPVLTGASYEWRSDIGHATERQLARHMLSSIFYYNSPVALMHRTGLPVRRCLAGPGAEIDFPLLEELSGLGGTEYLLFPLPLSKIRLPGFSLTTRDPAGFAPAHVALAERLVPALAALVEIRVVRLTTMGLLDVYVGPEARRRILEGQVTLGASRTIDAAIMFSDLRGFTALSEALPRAELLSLLNDYFGAMVRAAHKAGGEILKFMGDGLLAIFRLDDGEARDEACARGLIAAMEATAELDRINPVRRAAGQPEVHTGVALHVGSVLFGNIGGEDRLDFTVIGAAVNRAARIQELCRELGEPILTSRAFAEASPVPLRPVGRYALRGVEKLQRIFAPIQPDGLTSG